MALRPFCVDNAKKREQKNGRCARPTSDRSLAGAIAEAPKLFLLWLSKFGGMDGFWGMGEIKAVLRGVLGRSIEGYSNLCSFLRGKT